MVIYEVNLAVDASVAADFAAWLRPHVDQMLALPGFTGARLFSRRAEDENGPDERSLWTVHYELTDREALELYFRDHAERMRGDGLLRFGGRFEAWRRILELEHDRS